METHLQLEIFKANTYSTYSGPARMLSFLTVQRHLDRTVSPLHSLILPFHPDTPLFMYFNVFMDVCPYEEPVSRGQSCCISSWRVVFCYEHLYLNFSQIFNHFKDISCSCAWPVYCSCFLYFSYVYFPHAFGQRGIYRLVVPRLNSTDYFHFAAVFFDRFCAVWI